jgi:hypothetical protein
MSTDPESQLNIIDEISIESFDVTMLDDPDATLFVIAPNSGTVAGAPVALIDSIIQHFRKRPPTTYSPTDCCLNSARCAIRAPCPPYSTTSADQQDWA